MKRTLSCFLMILAFILVGAQQTEPVREEYLKKSKQQKTAAWILMASGTALSIGGTILTMNNLHEWGEPMSSDEEAGMVMYALGGCAVTGGIVLFTAAARNKRNARKTPVAMGFKMEKATIVRQAASINISYPALSLSLNLR